MALNSNFRTLTADNIEGIVEDRNYLKSSFENGTITGWTEVAVALTSGLPTGTPTIGATAASSLALSATSVTPLSGSRSLLVDVPSALTAGHGFISDEFTLDRMDLGKVLTVSFDYERVTGTYNFSGTLGSQTWMVYIYDATLGAANWIQPAGFLGMNQSSGPGRIRATFQSSVTAGQKYRVAVIASQAAAGASSIEFDNFSCSRQTAPIGPVVTDWVSYTPVWSSSGTQPAIGNGSIQGKWRRVGDSIEVDMITQFGTTTTYGTGAWYWSIPSGLSFDTSKQHTASEGSIGTAEIVDAGIQNFGPYNVSTASSSTVAIRLGNVSGTWLTSASIASPGNPLAGGNTDFITLHFSYPISGWSSNVQLSNDTDTRVVAFYANTSASPVPVGVMNFSAVYTDTHGGYQGSGVYRIPVSGLYVISVNGFKSNSVTSDAFLRINGIDVNLMTTTTSINNGTGQHIVSLKAGDTVSIYNNSAQWTPAVASWVTFEIQRLSGPSVVAASETVSEVWTNQAGTLLGASGTPVNLPFATKVVSTHGAWDGNYSFTAPVSGLYQFSIYVMFFVPTASTAGGTFDLFLNRSGTAFAWSRGVQLATNSLNTVSMTRNIRLNAGDRVDTSMRMFWNGATTPFLYNDSAANCISITRVGN